MKKSTTILVAGLTMLALSTTAFAATSSYIRYFSSGKAVAGSAQHDSNSRVYVTQESNVNTKTGATGPKMNYGARKTKTTSGSSICNAMSVSGYSGDTSAAYKSGQTPKKGATVYLVVQASKTASTGQWEVAGSWSP
jgi:hypothetical protein